MLIPEVSAPASAVALVAAVEPVRPAAAGTVVLQLLESRLVSARWSYCLDKRRLLNCFEWSRYWL